jgi:penicillin-binding protein 1C
VIGPDRLVARLANAGVRLALPKDAAPGLAVGLGGAGVRLIDLAALYLALARNGQPLRLSWQADARQASQPLRRLFEPQAAWTISDVLKGAPAPPNALGGQIAFKTGTSYGYRDAWAIGYDGATTIAVWAGRPDGAAVPGVVGRMAAAPILFEAFQRLGRARTPLGPPPAGTIIARSEDLPAALQRFRPNGLPEMANTARADTPPAIAFPPDGARIDLGDETSPVLSLKVLGGTPPFIWLADGVPVVPGEFRRDALWEGPSHGFTRLSVIDARGKTASARIRIE